jgi:hypothetical protein
VSCQPSTSAARAAHPELHASRRAQLASGWRSRERHIRLDQPSGQSLGIAAEGAAPWPARATDTQRATATPADIQTVIARYGPAAAVHVYGLRLAAPHLAAPDLPATGT